MKIEMFGSTTNKTVMGGDMGPKDVVAAIRRYCDDNSAEYAVMLTGGWGTGKTHFVKHQLANSLANGDEKIAVVRATLMGASSADEVYGRITQAAITAGLPISDGSEDGTGVSIAKTTVGTVLGLAEKKLKDAGLVFQLPSGICTAIALPNKCLVVLDDLERCPSLSHHDLYGVVANLVEGQGRKVLLVCNDECPDPLDEDKACADAKRELEEKLVWMRYRFEADTVSIVSYVLSSVFDGLAWKQKALDGAGRAFESTGSNIRSLKKARKVIEGVLKTSFMSDEGVDDDRKVRVMGTVALLSMRCASGKPPVAAKEIPSENYNGLVMAGAIDAIEEGLAMQYEKLPFIARFFEEATEVEASEIDTSIRMFADAEYPESEVELRALRGEEALRLSLLEDVEVVSSVEGIMTAFATGDVHVANIPRMLRALLKAKEYGFLSDSKLEEAYEYSKAILLRDPIASRLAMKESAFEWSTNSVLNSGELRDVLLQLASVVRDRSGEAWSQMVENRVSGSGESAGTELVRIFAECEEIALLLPSFPVEEFTDCVAGSNVNSINALREYLWSTFENVSLQEELVRANLHEWFQNASAAVSELKVDSRMRSLMLNYLSRDLSALEERSEIAG